MIPKGYILCINITSYSSLHVQREEMFDLFVCSFAWCLMLFSRIFYRMAANKNVVGKGAIVGQVVPRPFHAHSSVERLMPL